MAFDCEVAAGDMLEIRSTPGPDAPADVPKRWPIVPCPRDVASGEEVLIPCKRKVEASSAVHVVRSASTILEAEAAVREMREEEVRLAAAESGGVTPEACLEASEAGAGREGIAASELGVDCAPAAPARFAHARRRRENGAVSEPGAGGAHAVERHPGDIVDIAADGSTPLMITEHCLLTAEGPCSNNCLTCPRRLASQAGDRFLVELDRKSSGARLTVRVDEKGRTRLYRM